MRWRNIRLIFLREVRDQLRDRRTLFMIAILPLLLYPALGIGMMQMTVLFSEQPRTVVILGADELPAQPPLLDGDRIARNWFDDPADADKLKVITDLPVETANEPEEEKTLRRRLLAEADRFREPVREWQSIKESHARAEREIQRLIGAIGIAADSADDAKIDELNAKIDALRAQQGLARQKLLLHERQIAELFSGSDMQVLIIVPDGFAAHIAEVTAALKDRRLSAELDEHHFGPTPITNGADEKSLIAYSRVRDALENWGRRILEQRLSEANLPATVASPVNPDTIDVAQEHEIAATLWSKLFPALLVIMAITGAFYPAVDLAAGEKERGTMETLLICPASRSELVVGKFLTVMLFSMSTAVLNLGSMGLTGKYMVSLAGGGAKGPLARVTEIAFPSAASLMWLFVLLIPLAALFSALCLALATFARSSKEGQYYLTPLLMITLGITVFCLSPAVEITPFYSVMPVAGIALLLKGLLLAPNDAGSLYLYMVPVLATSVAYSLLALWWAIEQFKREDVLFREAERFEVRLWIQHLLRDKEPLPSFAEAGFCFVLIMLLQFGSLKFLGQAFAGASGAEGPLMLKLLIIQQLVIIASPALFMGVMLTASAVRTFRLHLPRAGMLGAAVVLPFALHPLSAELAHRMAWFFPQLPPNITRILSTMSDADLPLWFVLLAFAGAPAVCEELAFRGFILSGFQKSGRIGLAVFLSSLTFGIMHMIPQQVFNATLLGLVLGLLAVRSNSLWPCVCFHFLYNSLAVVQGRFAAGWADHPAFRPFVSLKEGAVRYNWLTLVLAAGIAIVLLTWLVRVRQQPQFGDADSMCDPPEADGLPGKAESREPRVQSLAFGSAPSTLDPR